MHNLNDIAAKELLGLFSQKINGQVIDEPRFYQLRKELTLAATTGLPYQWERLGDYMSMAQHIINQVKLPLTIAEQHALYEKMTTWCEQRLAETAKAGAPRADAPNISAAGAVVSSSSGLKKRGKVNL
jgi:hypothetical protein